MIDRDPWTPAPEPPAGYGPVQGSAFAKGWVAAAQGWSRSNPPPEVPGRVRWWQDCWAAGYDAYHQWLQDHRVRACDRDPSTET